MSGFELVASLVGSLAWPVAVVVAVVALRRPLSSAMGRVKHVEAAGVAVELAEVEQAREEVEQELAKTEALDSAEVDELVRKAAELGWHLAKSGVFSAPDVVVDRAGERPVVRSPMEQALQESARAIAREWGKTSRRGRDQAL